MISQTAEYALRAVLYLARVYPESSPTEQIAREMQIPGAYLYKVLQDLTRAGIVRSRRGKAGGVSLVQDPSKLSVLDVVNAVDPIQRLDGCPLELVEHAERLCPLHRRLDEAVAGIQGVFRQTTLAEILAESEGESLLCDLRSRPEPEPP